MDKNYLRAISVVIGATIGAGIFTIPFVISRAGFFLFCLYLPILAFIEYVFMKLYAEIVLSTQTIHRLPGYAEKYLGQKAKIISSIASIANGYGILLAYIIASGIFLNLFLKPWFGEDTFFYATIAFVIGSLIVFFGIKIISTIDVTLAAFSIIIIFLIIWRGFPSAHLSNYILIDGKNILLPYGPIFFAISGKTAVPEVCVLLKDKKEKIKDALAWGIFIPTIIIFIFVLMVVGITGINTTPDTLTGLNQTLGNGVVKLALLFGIISVFTSFLIIGQSLKEIYWWDFKINQHLAWLFTFVIPYGLYGLGVKDLTKIVSLSGSLAGGISGIILILIVLKVKKKVKKKSILQTTLKKSVIYALSTLFILGFLYEIWRLF